MSTAPPCILILRTLRDEMRKEGDQVGARVVDRCMRLIARKLAKRTDAGRKEDGKASE